jgi:acetylxylan esterase
VTATNASFNGSIAAGQSTTIGFQATHTGNTAAPTDFTLNGATCGTG